MKDRTIAIWGKAFSLNKNVKILVEYNGELVVNENVPSEIPRLNQYNIEDKEHVELCRWQCPLELTGSIPTKITVTGGDAMISHVKCNYVSDYKMKCADSGRYNLVLAENHFERPTYRNYYSDGKDNVTMNGVPQHRFYVEEYELLGEWQYVITENSVLDFDLTIDPDLVVCRTAFNKHRLQLQNKFFKEKPVPE